MFYVFRDDDRRESFLASRQRRAGPTLHARQPEVLVERYRSLFDAILPFFANRGRLPSVSEVAAAAELYRTIPRIDVVLGALRVAVGPEAFDDVVAARRQDLLVYLALARFDGRPSMRRLSTDLQLDVRSFFPSYNVACGAADELLFSVGQSTALEKAFSATKVGKLTGNALYVHVSAVSSLPVVLRVYEGCAKGYMGTIEGATLVKLHRREPQVSYLWYPDFDRVAHPALAGSLVVNMRRRSVRYSDYTDSTDPPILHREELFVETSYPKRLLFERLTRQEERLALLDEPAIIGTQSRWNARLNARQLAIVGHRVRQRMPTSDSP
jgi:DNA phosphorothioation-associated putative methyltransferase